jgi:hypothetical protein
MSAIESGATAPDFELPDQDGNLVTRLRVAGLALGIWGESPKGYEDTDVTGVEQRHKRAATPDLRLRLLPLDLDLDAGSMVPSGSRKAMMSSPRFLPGGETRSTW